MSELKKTQGFKFSLVHLGITLTIILEFLSLISIVSYFTGQKIYPFNFLFWNNPIFAIFVLLIYPVIIFIVSTVLSFCGMKSAKINTKIIFDDEPENIKYYRGKKSKNSYWEIIYKDEKVKIKKPKIIYGISDDVAAKIFYITTKEGLSFWEKFCLGAIDYKIQGEIIIPEKFKTNPNEYISYKHDKNDEPLEYTEVFSLKKGKNTYSFLNEENKEVIHSTNRLM